MLIRFLGQKHIVHREIASDMESTIVTDMDTKIETTACQCCLYW